MAKPTDRDVFVRGNRWWGYFPREGGEGLRRSLGLPASAPRKAALAKYVELSRRQPAGDYATHSTKVGAAFDAYLTEQARRGRSEATREIDRDKARHFVRVWGDAMPLDRVDAARVHDYITQREREGAHARTIQRELVVLRGMLKLAIHHGRFALPLERVMPIGFAPRYVPRTKWLACDVAWKVFDELLPSRRGWFAFAIATGARKSEIEAAELSDIGDDEVFIRGTKTPGSEDTVPITVLQRPWIEAARKYAKKTGPAFGAWTNVLRGLRHATDRVSTCASCRRGKRRDGRARGTPDPQCDACRKTPRVEHVTPNDLRRTLGMWLRDAGVEPHLIGKVLRHTDSRMAERVYGKGSKRGIAMQLATQIRRGTPDLRVPKTVRHSVRHSVQSGRRPRPSRRLTPRNPVEQRGIEPLTSALRTRRSPS